MEREFMDEGAHKFKYMLPSDGYLKYIYLFISDCNWLFQASNIPPLGTVGKEGCYLTALTNALKIIDFKLPGQNNIPKVMDLLIYCKENNYFSWDGRLKTVELFKNLGIGVIEKHFSQIDPSELASLLNKKSAVLMCMTSPTRSGSNHWVNAEKVFYKDGKAFVTYFETNKGFISKYGETISFDKLKNDKEAKLRIINNDKKEVECSNDGKGDGELDGNLKKIIDEQILKNSTCFKIGNSIGFILGDMLINYKNYKSMTELTKSLIKSSFTLVLYHSLDYFSPSIMNTFSEKIQKYISDFYPWIFVLNLTIGLLRILFRKDLNGSEKFQLISKIVIDIAVNATFSSIGIYFGAKFGASLGIVGGPCGFLIGGIAGGIAGGISGYLAPKIDKVAGGIYGYLASKTYKVVRGISKYFGSIF